MPVFPGVSSEEQGMLVRQSFPLHARGQLQDPSLSKEVSRIVTSQGAVIRYMRDSSTEVNALNKNIYKEHSWHASQSNLGLKLRLGFSHITLVSLRDILLLFDVSPIQASIM